MAPWPRDPAKWPCSLVPARHVNLGIEVESGPREPKRREGRELSEALALERAGDRDTVEIPNGARLAVARLEGKTLALGDVEVENLSSFLGEAFGRGA